MSHIEATSSQLNQMQVLAAFASFINQRPGLDFADYGNVSAWRQDSAQITRDRKRALAALHVAEIAPWDAMAMKAAFGAFSGRLTPVIREDGNSDSTIAPANTGRPSTAKRPPTCWNSTHRQSGQSERPSLGMLSTQSRTWRTLTRPLVCTGSAEAIGSLRGPACCQPCTRATGSSGLRAARKTDGTTTALAGSLFGCSIRPMRA